MQDYLMREAHPEDAAELLALYRAQVGTPGCTWDDEYPGAENIREDLDMGALYCLRQPDGRLAGAVSVGAFDELKELVWELPLQNPCELARICIRPELHGRGLATQLLKDALRDAARRGFDGVRLLVAVSNPAALALYAHSGFSKRGTVRMYGNDYFCMERALRAEK
ncbi:MAG: GNAT family N-acetyltransferase [Eubacteriales bacterium]|nr:GNAT family N-acetyltransferase [Eubacteriales bacterium]